MLLLCWVLVELILFGICDVLDTRDESYEAQYFSWRKLSFLSSRVSRWVVFGVQSFCCTVLLAFSYFSSGSRATKAKLCIFRSKTYLCYQVIYVCLFVRFFMRNIFLLLLSHSFRFVFFCSMKVFHFILLHNFPNIPGSNVWSKFRLLFSVRSNHLLKINAKWSLIGKRRRQERDAECFMWFSKKFCFKIIFKRN